MIWQESLPGVIRLAKLEQGDTQWNLLKSLPNNRRFWLSWYLELTKLKRLPKIEDLPQEDKNRLWGFVKTEAPGLPKEDKINLVKCITVINYLQNL